MLSLFVVVSLALSSAFGAPRAPRKCNPDPSAPHVNVTILTSIPGSPSWARNLSLDSHMYEIMLALGENSRSAEVGEIRVVMDSGPPAGEAVDFDSVSTRRLREDVLASQRAFAEKLDAPASKEQVRKVTAHVFGHQPTYVELFRYANKALPGRVVVLVNADVVLRKLDLLDASAFAKRLALVVTVRPPAGAFGRSCTPKHTPPDRCAGYWLGGYSFDGFIFHAPLPATAQGGPVRYDFLERVEPTPVLMNQGCAENRVAQFLKASGYSLENPCRLGMAEHWHCGPKMHNQGGVRVYAKHPTPEYTRLGGNGHVVPARNGTWYLRGLRCATTSYD